MVELQKKDFEVVIIDDLSNSSIKVLDQIEKITGTKPGFEKIDLKEKHDVSRFFNRTLTLTVLFILLPPKQLVKV